MKKVLVLAVAAAMLFVAAPSAQCLEGGLLVGVQGSMGDDSDFGVGARVEYSLEEMVGMPVSAAASFDYFFPDEPAGVDVTYWEANLNALYTVPMDMVKPYVGAGLNYAYAKAEAGGFSADDSQIGLNILGGAKIDVGMPFTPFAEFKLELNGGEQWVISAGVLF